MTNSRYMDIFSLILGWTVLKQAYFSVFMVSTVSCLEILFRDMIYSLWGREKNQAHRCDTYMPSSPHTQHGAAFENDLGTKCSGQNLSGKELLLSCYINCLVTALMTKGFCIQFQVLFLTYKVPFYLAPGCLRDHLCQIKSAQPLHGCREGMLRALPL